MAALIRITNRLTTKPNLPVVEVECNVRELAILIVALITFSAIAAIARPHEHHFVPQTTGLMPPVNVP
jgi:hypothetical protein